jgi:hypothetical protein
VTGVQTCALPISPKPQNPVRDNECMRIILNKLLEYNYLYVQQRRALRNPSARQ